MRGKDNLRSAAEVLVDQLRIHGVRHVFCVPGESYLAVLDAFHDSDLTVTVCRQEGGAAIMAESFGKVTGRPGVCFVTRGPGATNAAHGIHIARQDSSPMVMFVGQVARDTREREAFQELDYRAVFGSMAKWVTEIDDPARVPELVSRAFHTAANGRPGPVVVAIPEDMLVERIAVDDAPPFTAIETSPGAPEMQRFAELLSGARAPIVIQGGSRWSQQACDRMAAFAQNYALPVCTTFRRGHLFDQTHPCYAGDLGIGPNPKLLERIKSSDLVIAVGGRLGELPTQHYTLFDIPGPQMPFVHVHPGAEELGRVYSPQLAINATPTAFTAALENLTFARAPVGDAKAAHADYLAWTAQPTEQPGAVTFGAVMVWLRENLAPDVIICNGAGDGDFLMNGQEFATAVQYDLPFTTIVFDNGMYGTIRMHQEREYPGRISATALRNPDFPAYARAFGGFGVSVERTEDFAKAFREAEASGKPAIVRLLIDPESITPGTTLAKIRAKALAEKR